VNATPSFIDSIGEICLENLAGWRHLSTQTRGPTDLPKAA
jgi:hypothetical protein